MRPRLPHALLVILLSVLGGVHGTPAMAKPRETARAVAAVTPRSAAAFRDSVGVNVHMSYYDTAYRDFPAARAALLDLGIRQVRDGACAGCTGQNERLALLGRAGVKLTLIMGRPGGGEPLPALVGAAERLVPYLSGLEGPNEYDASGDAGWASALRRYQAALWTSVRASSTLSRVPVIAPSLTSAASFAALGDLTRWADCGNVHPYAGGDMPSAPLAFNLAAARRVSGARPICATEAGYHNATADASGHAGVSEAVAAAYVPRLYLEFFGAGVRRTFLYELADQWPDPARDRRESNFGLLRSDFSPKPAYRSLRALLRLTEPEAPVRRLQPLRIAVDGSRDLRWLLLQTSRKQYSVVLWRNMRIWDPIRHVALRSAGTDAATVTLGQAASVLDATAAGPRVGAVRAARAGQGRRVVLRVGADPVVVRLRAR